jgi:hypothetical protein
MAGLSLASRTQERPHGALATLYKTIFSGYENGQPPRLVDVTNVLDVVPQMGSDDVRSALPLISSAIQSPRLEIRSYGELGIYAINLRPDSANFIADLVPMIAKNLRDPDRHIRSGAILALSTMKPRPSEEAIAYLTRRSRNQTGRWL